MKEVADKLESKESIITDLQQQTHQLKQELGLKSEEIESFVQRVAVYEEKLKANGAMLETNQALISEYKDKNDTLNGLVVKYQAYAEENEEVKRLFEAEKAKVNYEREVAILQSVRSLRKRRPLSKRKPFITRKCSLCIKTIT